MRGRAKKKYYQKLKHKSKIYSVGLYVRLHKAGNRSRNYLFCRILSLYETVLNTKRMKIEHFHTYNQLYNSGDKINDNILIKSMKRNQKCFRVTDIADNISVVPYHEFLEIRNSDDVNKKLKTFYIQE
ncbi:uncharacterized protein LOC118761277 [Octopus sinensis]|uniref:Uncharacterized protein LOC118761277 n=1 Tax=Octopus sinensis TaxID=2607531 RepID=A0A7E6EIZ2_9MOLL|nr:uncharacterized protein LOC118761277 [Octopus sinensis]